MESFAGTMANAYPHARQLYEETQGEKDFRAHNKFPEIEATMPKLASRRRASLIDTFSSWLGEKNPLSHPVDSKDHAVWILDNTAYHPSDGDKDKWAAEFVVAYFIKNSGKDVSTVAADLAEKLGIGRGDAQEKTIAERLQPLLDSILPAHTVQVQISSDSASRLGPSDKDGISSQIVNFTGTHADGDTAVFNAVGIQSATPCRTTFAEAEGWAVISDIDDTIKLTMTASPTGILKTTFAQPFTPITGMPELYKHLKQKLSNPPFWYLSASPYNLYPFLRDFREQYYPPGTLILRDASWMNLGGFLASLTQGTQAYKVDRMEKVHRWFPRRKFVCLGDSTQSDPEAYAEMYRRYPEWVGKIFIRKVTGVAEVDETKKNSDERFEEAFKDVPADIYYVFEKPEEVYEKVDALLSGGKN
jgi:phosphatidate phosphatase APP1